MFCVAETASFTEASKDLGLTEQEIERIVETISNNPLIGDLIPGTGGARKWRVASGNKGKSGGYRVISYFAGDEIPVFLLDIFSKSEKINLTMRERNELRIVLGEIADEYRRGVRQWITHYPETGR